LPKKSATAGANPYTNSRLAANARLINPQKAAYK